MLSRRTILAAIGPLLAAGPAGQNSSLWQHFQHHADFAALGAMIDIPVDQAVLELGAQICVPQDASALEVLAALHRNMITDFESERTVSVQGWQISRTEALMAVLAHHGHELV